jgi:hypothetical protein
MPILCLFLALSLALAPAAANGAETLAQTVLKADAKYLAVKGLKPIDTAPKIETGEEEGEGTPKTREIAQGPIRAILSYVEGKNEQGKVTPRPGGHGAGRWPGSGQARTRRLGMSNPPVSVQIAELDPANATPEVVVSFYTGGAHCCSDTKVLTQAKGGSSWQTVKLGELDGGPLTAADLDGDGRYEFESRDNAFLYTFGC